MINRLKKNHFLWYQGPMILWGVLLFVQSSVPGDKIPNFEWLSHDKAIHLVIYIVFAWAVDRALQYQSRFPFVEKNHLWFTILVVAVFGFSDELHQYFVPNRSASVADWAADCLGAVVMSLIVWAKSKMKPAKPSA